MKIDSLGWLMTKYLTNLRKNVLLFSDALFLLCRSFMRLPKVIQVFLYGIFDSASTGKECFWSSGMLCAE